VDSGGGAGRFNEAHAMMQAWQALLHDYVLLLSGWLLALAFFYAFLLIALEGVRWESFALFRFRKRPDTPQPQI
jgi:hypothetical protein